MSDEEIATEEKRSLAMTREGRRTDCRRGGAAFGRRNDQGIAAEEAGYVTMYSSRMADLIFVEA